MAHSRTIISLPPGYDGRTASQAATSHRDEVTADAGAAPRANAIIKVQGRAIVGLLYSVSRSPLGEIFPIYIGKTIIGSDPDSDICLRESSVLPCHATIVTRRLCDDSGVMHTSMSVSPAAQGAEIQLDGETPYDGRIYCRPGQVLTIGAHYRLQIVALAPENAALYTDPAFDSLPPLETIPLATGADDPYAPVDQSSASFRNTIAEEDERSFYAPSKPKGPATSQTLVEDRDKPHVTKH